MTQFIPRVGRVQLRILEVLWRRNTATAREITLELSASSPMARSTVQTLLRQMEAKNLVTHTDTDGIFYFRPMVEQSEIADTAADDLLNRMFHGSLYNLVSHLLKPERIDTEELGRIRDLIDEKRNG